MLIVLGILALVSPLFAGLAVALLLGWLPLVFPLMAALSLAFLVGVWLLLAALMFALSAVGSTVMIGFIVGIDLIFAGLALLASLWPKARAAVGVPTGATAAP